MPESKVVLITGASGGLGSALVERFATNGWRVVAAAHASPGKPTANCFPIVMDVTDSESVKAAVESTLENFQRIDALINNAGVIADALLPQLDDEAWDHVLDVNLRGAFLCSQAVTRQMIRQRDGHIINISSQAVRLALRGRSNYAAAKAGLIGLTQSLAKELGSRNVCVNAIFPGLMPTKMTAALSAEQLQAFAEANALGRINSVEEVARFIVFLATTQNISGQVFTLDSRIAPWA